MKIGLLQAGHFPDVLQSEMGDYDQMFTRLLDGHGFSFEAWPVVDGVFPSGPDDADGWLVTGSRHGAYEDLPWIPPLEDLVRAIKASGRPLIGVCFGHQIIAQALGGRVEKFSGGWAVGRQTYRYGDHDITLNAWHQDQVVALPDGAQVLGGSAFCENGILAYGDKIWTVQPHPEFDAPAIRGLLRTRGRDLLPEDVQQSAAASLDGPSDRLDLAAEMAAFFLGKAKT